MIYVNGKSISLKNTSWLSYKLHLKVPKTFISEKNMEINKPGNDLKQEEVQKICLGKVIYNRPLKKFTKNVRK